jgi:hypothetical protein
VNLFIAVPWPDRDGADMRPRNSDRQRVLIGKVLREAIDVTRARLLSFSAMVRG